MSPQVVVGNMVEEIKKAPLPIFHQGGLDMWTCKVSGRKYLAIHGFYVDSKFVLQNGPAAVQEAVHCFQGDAGRVRERDF